MEQLKFQYKAKRTIYKNAHVGVVGSGDLEILIEPTKNENADVHIRTQIEGFGGIWKDIMDRFFLANNIVAKIEINDFGATPGVVFLRLAQAMEVLDS